MRAMHEKEGEAGKTHLWPFGLAQCYSAAVLEARVGLIEVKETLQRSSLCISYEFGGKVHY